MPKKKIKEKTKEEKDKFKSDMEKHKVSKSRNNAKTGLRFGKQFDGIQFFMLTKQLRRVDDKLEKLHDHGGRKGYTDDLNHNIRYFGEEKSLLLLNMKEVLNKANKIKLGG